MIVPWERWQRRRYGLELSYQKGMAWLAPCHTVEDWGCGGAAYAKKFRNGRYIGIDGTGPAADFIADLSTHRSKVDGLFMRGILEHNYDWRRILENALASFQKRMFLMLYRPLQEVEKIVIAKDPIELDLPADVVLRMTQPFCMATETIGPSAHGFETLFYLEKSNADSVHGGLRAASDAGASTGND